MQVCSTLASVMRILCIRKHLTIDPCYGPFYHKIVVLIDNLCLEICKPMDGVLLSRFDDSIKTTSHDMEGSRPAWYQSLLSRRGGAYGMNMIKRVSKEGTTKSWKQSSLSNLLPSLLQYLFRKPVKRLTPIK